MVLFKKDPDERLAAVNTKFEWIYGHLRQALENWYCVALALISMLITLLSHFLYGEFDVERLFHPMRIRWIKKFKIVDIEMLFVFSLLQNYDISLTQFALGSDHAARIFWWNVFCPLKWESGFYDWYASVITLYFYVPKYVRIFSNVCEFHWRVRSNAWNSKKISFDSKIGWVSQRC